MLGFLKRLFSHEEALPPRTALEVVDKWLACKYRDGWEVVVNNEPMTLPQALHYMHILQEKTGQGFPYLPMERNWNKVVR
jgi:hypothetical protein